MASKYDSVKVKVHVGEHYYIFSRFLLSKILTFCEVPTATAVRLSLDLKKDLVDKQLLDITQQELQQGIFSMMQHSGFGSHIRLYTTMTQFYAQRVPLIVFVAGTGCCGKSTVTQLLGSKLSHHNIVNTEVIMDTVFSIAPPPATRTTVAAAAAAAAAANADVASSPAGALPVAGEGGSNGAAARVESEGMRCDGSALGTTSDPLWFAARDPHAISTVWLQRCQQVAQYLERDLQKTLQEGKVLLVEGTYLNLPLFTQYFTTVAQYRKAIVLAFVLHVPPKFRCAMTEQWLVSRTHFLSDMSLALQEEHISTCFNAVHATHMASLAAHTSLAAPAVTVVDFLPDDTAATVSRMHTQLLHRIVERLDAPPSSES